MLSIHCISKKCLYIKFSKQGNKLIMDQNGNYMYNKIYQLSIEY